MLEPTGKRMLSCPSAWATMEGAMQSKTLAVLSAVAILVVSSTARDGGVSHGGMSMHSHGHFARHFDHRFRFFNRFNRNPFLFGSGWGWDWGGGYGEGYGNNTTVVVS